MANTPEPTIEVELAYWGMLCNAPPKFKAVSQARWTKSQIILIAGTFRITEGDYKGCGLKDSRFWRKNGRRVGAMSAWDSSGWRVIGDHESKIKETEGAH